MATRLISAVVAVVILIAALFVNNYLGIRIAVYAIALLCAAGVGEMLKALGITKHKPLVIIAMVSAVTVIFAKGFTVEVLSVTVIALFVAAVFSGGKIKFGDICAVLFSCVYIPFGFYYLNLSLNMEYGIGMLFFVLISAFITDTGAYFAGRAFGKHKLCERLSPKKTVEGAIGGTVFAILVIIVYKFVMQSGVYGDITVNTLNSIIIVTVASVCGQIGDLSASLVKREYGIKDYGNIMPGHGGVLDRFDSILFVAPVVYFLNGVLPIIN